MPRRQTIVGISLNNLAKDYEPSDILRTARLAEELGFDAVWVHDAPMGRRTVAAWDPVTVLSGVAAVTRKVKLCSGVIQPHLRNPIWLATAWATMDSLSGGRSVFGVGSGAGVPSLVKRNYEALSAFRPATEVESDQLYKHRRRIFDEAVEIIRLLWQEDKLSYKGAFYSFDEITLGTARPRQKPNPPVLLAQGIYYPQKYGGPVHHAWNPNLGGRFVLGPCERILRLGDGWITCHATPEEYAAGWQRLQTRAADLGRDLERFILAFNCFVNVNSSTRQAWEEVRGHLNFFHGPPVPDDIVDRWAVAGSANEIISRLRQYLKIGVSVFQLVIGSRDRVGQMKRLATEVLPALREVSQ